MVLSCLQWFLCMQQSTCARELHMLNSLLSCSSHFECLPLTTFNFVKLHNNYAENCTKWPKTLLQSLFLTLAVFGDQACSVQYTYSSSKSTPTSSLLASSSRHQRTSMSSVLAALSVLWNHGRSCGYHVA